LVQRKSRLLVKCALLLILRQLMATLLNLIARLEQAVVVLDSPPLAFHCRPAREVNYIRKRDVIASFQFVRVELLPVPNGEKCVRIASFRVVVQKPRNPSAKSLKVVCRQCRFQLLALGCNLRSLGLRFVCGSRFCIDWLQLELIFFTEVTHLL